MDNLINNLVSILIWGGLVTFTIGLSFVLWTRWGKYHLLTKCIILSMMAHVVFGMYFTAPQVVSGIQAFVSMERSEQAPDFTELEVPISLSPAATAEVNGADQAEGADSIGMGDRVNDVLNITQTELMQAPEQVNPELNPTMPAEQIDPNMAIPDTPEIEQARAEAAASRPEPVVAAEPTRSGVAPEATQAQASQETQTELVPNANVAIAPKYGEGRPNQGSSVKEGPSFAPSFGAGQSVRPSMGTGNQQSNQVIPGPARSTDNSDLATSPNLSPIVSPNAVRVTGAAENGEGSNNVGGSPTGTQSQFTFRPRIGTGLRSSPSLSPGSGNDLLSPRPNPRTNAFPKSRVSFRPATGAVRPGTLANSNSNRDNSKNVIKRPELYRSRTQPNRMNIAIGNGASKESELAVATSLKWLAAHQDRDGRWNADGYTQHCVGGICRGHGNQTQDDCATSGLILLAYLGAGHTHQSGEHRETVRSGLSFLLAQQKADGDLRGQGRMYSHGIATLALSEALGMTGDPMLRAPVERAVRYIVNAQHPTSGGWRYQPGQYGDTSIFGWQLMALKSAGLTGIPIPDITWRRAARWLDLVGSGGARGLASYLPGERPTPAMTAEAQVCRLFLGVDVSSPSVTEAADYLMNYIPRWERRNLYYWYYGTLANFQTGGRYWEAWNASMRDELVNNQVTTGHSAGSWNPAGDPWAVEGGRLYSTAMATLCLEIYYRYLPLQSLKRE